MVVKMTGVLDKFRHRMLLVERVRVMVSDHPLHGECFRLEIEYRFDFGFGVRFLTLSTVGTAFASLEDHEARVWDVLRDAILVPTKVPA
jgi:hypothetical protein